MASGKSAQIVLLCNKEVVKNRDVLLIVPSISVRGEQIVHTRDKLRPKCRVLELDVHKLEVLLDESSDVIAIDEAQFFENLTDVARKLRRRGKQVIVSGLAVDWKLSPFGEMFNLLRYSDQTMHLHAVCNNCHADNATLTYNYSLASKNKSKSKRGSRKKYEQLLIGDEDDGYVSLCQLCYEDCSK